MTLSPLSASLWPCVAMLIHRFQTTWVFPAKTFKFVFSQVSINDTITLLSTESQIVTIAWILQQIRMLFEHTQYISLFSHTSTMQHRIVWSVNVQHLLRLCLYVVYMLQSYIWAISSSNFHYVLNTTFIFYKVSYFIQLIKCFFCFVITSYCVTAYNLYGKGTRALSLCA
jgi:hypothetical protein